MRLYGRLTLFGEYLMHDIGEGLVVPSRRVLGDESEERMRPHADYVPERDATRSTLARLGVSIERPVVRGDLPLGAGLAGSTLLGRILLRDLPEDRVRNLLMEADRLIHGFPPSGMDLEFALRQEMGLFGPGGWRDVALSMPDMSLVTFPKEGDVALPEVRSRIMRRGETLGVIAADLADGCLRGVISYETLLRYARELAAANVYSRMAASFSEDLLAKGIVVKGIGGLYDKAMLIVWPSNVDGRVAESIRAQTRSQRGMRFYNAA